MWSEDFVRALRLEPSCRIHDDCKENYCLSSACAEYEHPDIAEWLFGLDKTEDDWGLFDHSYSMKYWQEASDAEALEDHIRGERGEDWLEAWRYRKT